MKRIVGGVYQMENGNHIVLTHDDGTRNPYFCDLNEASKEFQRCSENHTGTLCKYIDKLKFVANNYSSYLSTGVSLSVDEELLLL